MLELLAVADKLPKYEDVDVDEDETNFDENDECCICLEKDNLWKTSCNHIVCKNCIPQMKNKICPMCRKNLLKEINQLIQEKNNIEQVNGFSFSNPTSYFFVDRPISNEDRVGREDENQRYSDRGFTPFGSISGSMGLAYST